MIPERLDPSQRAVLDLPLTASAAVLGAPGTGKTATAAALVADRIVSGALPPEAVLLLTPRRARAARLRDGLLLAVGRPVDGPLARTPASLAFDVARRAAVADGRPAPVLLAGGEQDRLLAELLPEPRTAWPARLGAEVRGTRAFRGELRELWARAVERGAGPEDLERLGREAGRPEWTAAGAFWSEYLEALQGVAPEGYDSAELAALAAAAIARGSGGELAERLRLVVVDDLQDAGESTVGLLAALADRGCAVVAFGDPDVAADTFRGGEPDLLGRFGERLGLPDAATLRLAVAHRQPATLRAFTARVTERIGTALAGPQRTAAAAVDGGAPVTAIEAPGPGELARRVAHLLRDRHLDAGVAFRDQAVVVRSAAQVEPLVTALEIAGVPAVSTTAGATGPAERAPRALLEVVAVAVGVRPLDPASAAELLTGPVCGLDRLTLRRLRLGLRAEELAGDGARDAGALLVEALGDPRRLATVPHAARAARLAAVLAAVREQDAAGASAEELLWLVWERSGLAGPWRERALAEGVAAAEANQDLDGVVALFAAAARAAERAPLDPAAVFVQAQLDADVADDSLAPRGRRDGVLVTTPVGASGLEFDTVVVAGLQDGVWPDLRVRGSLLGAPALARLLDGRGPAGDERRAVLSDELRLFALAVSRARTRLVLAAVVNDDEAPSVLLGLADGPEPDAAALRPNALRPLVGHLRRLLVTAAPGERAAAAGALARLAVAEVPGADPGTWWGLAAPSTTEPLQPDPDAPVRVSPSKLERFEASPLDWFAERVGGGEPLLAGAVGTLLHQVLEQAAEPDEALLLADLEGRWRELDFDADWIGVRERRTADRMVRVLARYLRQRQDAGWEVAGRETAFEFRSGRALARGTIDRIERDPAGRVHVIDLKTGTTRPTKAELPAHAQLGVYQLAVLQGAVDGVAADAQRGGAALLHVKVKEGAPFALLQQEALDEPAADGFRQRLAAAAEGMAAAGFDGTVEPEVRHGGSAFRPWLLRVPEVCGA